MIIHLLCDFLYITDSSVQSEMSVPTALFDFFARVRACDPTKQVIHSKSMGQLPCIFIFMSQYRLLTHQVTCLSPVKVVSEYKIRSERMAFDMILA